MSRKFRLLSFGTNLLRAFLITTLIAFAWAISGTRNIGLPAFWSQHWNIILAVSAAEFLLFWAGIILVYLTSVQLGIKRRVIGAVLGWIPVVNLITLTGIIHIAGKEVRTERKRIRRDKKRAGQQVCALKYPILMVHGVFFRDSRYFNYWGRIPEELETNGARIFYGEHQSAASVADSAEELKERIMHILSETGAAKVNVIAHSKGGLDTRYAIENLGMAPYIASLTTINTPHRGCEFADFLLDKAPEGMKEGVSGAYNAALKKIGDPNPDFMAAVTDLTASSCRKRNEETYGFDYGTSGVYTQSVGSCMKKAGSGAFPLNMSYHLVKYFDGPNDGLVGEPSFHFGEKYTFLENKESDRGISHGDMIDLNRENIDGFDVREFYVQLVSDLKDRGC